MGRWSRSLAAEAVAWLKPPPGLRWLDIGCGTGALSAALLNAAEPASLVGLDPSLAYVRMAQERHPDPRATFAVGDSTALDLPDGAVDRVVSGLVLNFVPDQDAALREIRRVLVPGGVAAAYVWNYADGMAMLLHFWDVAVAENPAASAFAERTRFPLCHPNRLEQLFIDSGLTEVTARTLEVPTVFADFDDYWEPFLGGQGPGPTYCTTLSEQARDRLRDRLRSTLPTEPDGSIRLTARAFAVQGTSH